MSYPKIFTQIIQSHLSLLKTDLDRVANAKDTLKLPVFTESDLNDELDYVTRIFSSEPLILDVTVPCIVVGDIHGHLLDLYRIFIRFGFPPSRSYMFLGDVVDRGEFSLEVVTFLFALKVVFPRNVFIIRGNHEFDDCCSNGGFRAEIMSTYHSQTLYNKFLSAFSQMPIASKLFGKIFCIHAGLSPGFHHIDQLYDYNRPISNFHDHLLSGIFWSDPTDFHKHFGETKRHYGYTYGSEALQDFLSNNDMFLMIRGHECIQKGFENRLDNLLMTVFSASNYCGSSMNSSAVIAVFGSSEIEPIQMQPLKYLKRKNAKFVEYSPDCFSIKQVESILIPLPRSKKVKSRTTRAPSRILDPSHLSIPVNHPLFLKGEAYQKLKQISRYREIGSCRMPAETFGNLEEEEICVNKY